MKKRLYSFLSVLLTIVIAVSCVASSASAYECECKKTPVILISGFGATTLAEKQDDGTLKAVFPPDISRIKKIVGENGESFKELLPLIFEKADSEKMNPAIQKAVYGVIESVLEPIAVNDDGTSKHNVVPIVSGAENTSYKAFRDNDMLKYIPYADSEFLDMKSIAEKVGDDHVFNFTYDWRKSHGDVADELLDYIEDVMKLTGHNKVSLYSISQGSLIAGEYLYKYADKGYIENSVMDTPLLGGSDLITDIYKSGKIKLNYYVWLDIIEEILHTEFEISDFDRFIDYDIFNEQADLGAKNLVLPMIINSPSFWEMLPPEKFDELKSFWLDDEENAEVIRKVKAVHNGFMSNISKTLYKAKDAGADVSIKSCSGSPIATGTYDNSDGIVNLKYSCGASCSEYGKTFDDNYVQKKDIGHYSISPDRTVDISTGYMPERTWIVSRHYHGQLEWDKNTLALVEKLLYTHEIKDAYSSYEFPQFIESSAPNSDITAYFTSTNSSFLSFADGKAQCSTIVIKNVSQNNTMLIKSISSDNQMLKLNIETPIVLKAGQSIKVGFTLVTDDCPMYDSISFVYSEGPLFIGEKSLSIGITALENYGGVVREDNSSENGKGNSFFEKIVLCFSDIMTKLWNLISGAK